MLAQCLLDVLLGVQPNGRVELLVYYLRAGGHCSVVRSTLVRRSDSCERRRCLSLTERPAPAHNYARIVPMDVFTCNKQINILELKLH